MPGAERVSSGVQKRSESQRGHQTKERPADNYKDLKCDSKNNGKTLEGFQSSDVICLAFSKV